MRDFTLLIKRAKEMCSKYEKNGFSTYLTLFNDNAFCQLLEEYENDKESTLMKALASGYRACDIQDCFTMLTEEPIEYDDEVDFWLPNELVPVNKQVTVADDPAPGETQDSVPYYYALQYVSTCDVGAHEKHSIVLKSNYFNLDKTISPVLKFLTIERKANDWAIERQPDFCYNINSHASVSEYFLNDNNSIITLHGEIEPLGELYYLLLDYLQPLNNTILIAESIRQLKERVSQAELINIELISIERLNSSEAFISCMQGIGILTIGDLISSNRLIISDTNTRIICKALDSIDTRQVFASMMSILRRLDPKEYVVLKYRFLGESTQTLEAVGKQFGVTRERIRQVERHAQEKIEKGIKQIRLFIGYLMFYSHYKNFITFEELKRLDVPVGFIELLSKVTNRLILCEGLNLCSFHTRITDCEEQLDTLPSSFSKDMIDAYAERIAQDLEMEFSTEEVKYIIIQRFEKYGDFYSRTRIKLETVFTYLLETYFPNGIDVYDISNLDFLRVKAREHFDGYELADKNRAISARLVDYCFPVGRGVWKLRNGDVLISPDLKQKIEKYIDEFKTSIIPIQAIFIEFNEELISVGINNKYYLQGQLKTILGDKYSLNRDYLFKGEEISYYGIIEQFIKNANRPVTKNDIITEFPGVTDIVIMQMAAATRVMNMNGYFIHLDNLNITDEEVERLKACIDEVLDNNSIYHTRTILNRIRTKMEGLFSRIGIEHYLQLYYLINELYPNDYEFNRPFIANIGVEIISGEEQLIAKLAGKNIIEISEIRETAKQVGTVIDRYIEFVNKLNDLYVFNTRHSIVSVEYLDIAEGEFRDLDSILDRFVGESHYRALNEFFDYWKLPELVVPWSDWLLYSIINKYSDKYTTTTSSNYLADAIPVVIKGDYDENLVDFSNMVQTPDYTDDQDVTELLDIDDLL